MKKLFSLIFLTITIAANAQDSTKVKKDTGDHWKFKAEGMVSFKYKSSGCGTVILITNKKDTNIFIPMGNGLGEYEVDGMKISFDYAPLKIRNPRGCFHGGPVRIWNIQKVKEKKRHSGKKKQQAE
jgi:hypothetical protein